MTLIPEHWLQPDWPAPQRVRAVMTDRHGGLSGAPWDSMNLGDHVGDVPSHVAGNRQRLHEAIGAHPVFLKQVHGVEVLPVHAGLAGGTEADACFSQQAGVACTIMVADCLPVLMCDAAGRWVAAAHAGWRGLAGEVVAGVKSETEAGSGPGPGAGTGTGLGVLESLLNTAPLSGTPAHQILVWLGPCIGPQAFEVGPEVKAAFCRGLPAAEVHFQPNGPHKWWADLPGLARLRLQMRGVTQIFGNNSQPQWCTASQGSKFFSHRRDSRLFGQSGRMAACIWLDH